MLRQTPKLLRPLAHSILLRVPLRSFAQVVEKVPALGDSISEGTIVRWEKKPGDLVKLDEVICVLETDKVSVEIRATNSGKLVSVAAGEGQTVTVGAALATVDTDASVSDSKPTAAAPPKIEVAAKSETKPELSNAPPPPKVAVAAPTSAPTTSTKASIPASAPVSIPSSPKGSRTERVVPLSRMRLTIAKRLKDAQNTAAMLTTFQEIDMTGAMDMRSKFKDDFEKKHNAKLGFMSIFVKASAQALQNFPAVNAFFDEQNKRIVYRDYVDISVAVGTPTGLVVPVLRNCESMGFQDVEQTIASLGQRARKGQIALEEMAGGTFTISNGGVYGSLMGTPIINPPQSAILGMHGIVKRPVAINDKVEIRPMMYVALTYDHRIIDGADAVTFLRAIKAYVEDPTRLLLAL